MVVTRVLVRARDRRGKALVLPALRETYDEATATRPERPALFRDGKNPSSSSPAEAIASIRLSARKSPAAFAALLRGLVDVSRKHRHVELFVETPGEPASPFARGIGIFRGNFEAGGVRLNDWLDSLDAARTANTTRPRLPETTPHPGAERIGDLGPLVDLLRGLPVALAWSGAVYVTDGPQTARRITPPGRFSPAAWSHDGKRLAIFGRSEGGETSLWISHAGSGAIAAVATLEGAPTGCAFSPDGSSIAITTATGRLAIVAADGNAAASITVARGLPLADPAWSLDGESVACLAEDASRARTLHLVAISEGKKGRRLLATDAPAGKEDVALADPEFSEDGNELFVRGLFATSAGEARVPRLLRVTTKGGGAEAIGPPLSAVRLRGGLSRFRDHRLFVAGIGSRTAGRPSADSAWLDPSAPDVATVVRAPSGARLAFGAPDLSVVFVRRTTTSTRLWRAIPGRPTANVRLPFPAWLSVG